MLKSILEKIKNIRVLVVGDVMLDHYIHGDATRISPEAPVPVVSVSHDRYVAGGAANVALNIRSLGASCELCGISGNDEAGKRLEEVFSENQIKYNSGFRKENVETILKSRVLVRNQQLCRIDRELPVQKYEFGIEEKNLLSKAIANADAIIISDYAKGTVSMELLDFISKEVGDRDVLVSLDPKPRRKLPFKNIGLITPNKLEAIELAGMQDEIISNIFPAEEICNRIWNAHKPQKLVITLGPDGMLLSENGQIDQKIPTYAREVFDVSGAGDTVIASLTLALAAKIPFENAAHFANTAAGIVVGKFGTATASPEEILNFEKIYQIKSS